ncbi:hypothetical protein ES708_33262 [subsurface metagenome]
MKAKQIDNELADMANKSINAYSQHFPDTETIFFHGLKAGDRYTVGCWKENCFLIYYKLYRQASYSILLYLLTQFQVQWLAYIVQKPFHN